MSFTFQEKSTLTSPPKKTKKSSKSKIIDEQKEDKKGKSKSSEKAAPKELEQEASEPISEQKHEEKEAKPVLPKIGMILKPYFSRFCINYHFNINSFVCFLESTSSETKKSKLQRQKTEIISSPAKEDDESKMEIVEEKPEKKPVPKPRGPIQVVQKPDESAATDETKARSDWDSEDDTKEPSEKTEDPKTEIADEDSEEEEDEDSEEEDEDEEETGN